MQYSDLDVLLKKPWNNPDGKQFSIQEIFDVISKADCGIYVGSDSNPSRLPVVMATSIALWKRNEYAQYFYVKSKPWDDKKPTLQQRLQHEVVSACHIANEIRALFPDREIIVHADVNPDHKTASGKFAKQLKNYIIGYGFQATIKPMSWAASCIADKYAC